MEKGNQVYKSHKYLGAIGGGLTVCFTQTSVGCSVVLKCSCGESFNATDYDSW